MLCYSNGTDNKSITERLCTLNTYNAFSMGDLKRFSDIIYGPIIALHSSNNMREKGMWPGSRDPVHFCALNANTSKMAKGTNFPFGRRAPRDSADMTLTNVSEMCVWSGSTDPLNFMALNANSSKIAKDRNFKFGTRDHSDSPYMTLDKMTP